MEIELREEPMSALAEYASISIAFDVNRILEVGESDMDAVQVDTERPILDGWQSAW